MKIVAGGRLCTQKPAKEAIKTAVNGSAIGPCSTEPVTPAMRAMSVMPAMMTTPEARPSMLSSMLIAFVMPMNQKYVTKTSVTWLPVSGKTPPAPITRLAATS